MYELEGVHSVHNINMRSQCTLYSVRVCIVYSRVHRILYNFHLLSTEYSILPTYSRFAAAKCLTALARVLLTETMTAVILEVVPGLEGGDLTARQGGVEVLARLADTLTVDLLPFIVLLVVPLLGRMSDSNQVE